MKNKSVSESKLKIFFHLMVWALLFILPTYLLYDGTERDRTFMMVTWLQLACYAIIFYTSYSLLAPRFFFTGQKLTYFLFSGLLILVFAISLGVVNSRVMQGGRVEDWERIRRMEMAQGKNRTEFKRMPPFNKPPSPFRNWPLFNFVMTSCMITGLSLGLRFSEKLVLNERMRKEAEKEKLHNELALLKHQINPHFLFNTLNSIYSLALIKSDQTAEAVMKLSDMMRYVIQDVEHETVPLELELAYVNHYVELQKIRLSQNVDVQIHLAGDPKPYVIPPMILVPFIENAFKYGTSSHENAMIRIDLSITEGVLTFKVSNQVFAGREKMETFGIGIQNTRQRLNLMYPGRHQLDLTNTSKVFMVNLEITLV